jgi:hypothetical protein
MIRRLRTDLQPKARTWASERLGIDVPPEDRAVVRFATFELFVVLYLEKFGVGSAKSQIAIPIFFMFAGLIWMIMTRRITFSATRLGLYLIFVSCCLFSSLLANSIGSILSIMDLLLLCSFLTTSAPLSEAGYFRVLDNFVKLMIVPAIIVLIQFGIQRITGQADPINMNAMLPKSILMQGYVYHANYPHWDSPFQRPNGFFFLEPSFVSFFTASAVIIEFMFFRRLFLVILMIVATALTQGSTGITVLILASPFLLARESPRLVLPIVVTAIAGIFLALMLGADLPLVSRLSELDTSNVGAGYEASGALRLIIPWQRFITFLSDPSFLLTGTGAGSTVVEDGSAWPIVKLTREYGVITMISYVVFFASAFAGRYNIPLKVAAWVIFNFTGGYLLDSTLIITFSILFCIIEPVRSAAGNEVRGSVEPDGVAQPQHASAFPQLVSVRPSAARIASQPLRR